MNNTKNLIFDSPLGKREADSAGSVVGVTRLDAEKSYSGIGDLLQTYINESHQESWNRIRGKIDYTYDHLDPAMNALLSEPDFHPALKARLEQGQKLLFKPNTVAPRNIDPQTHGPDNGSTASTEWAFVAALMRWFHDRLDVSYHRMCIGEAATAMSAAAGYYTMHHPEGRTVTTEAVLEGRSDGFYGGWGFYFVRKYLSESLDPGAGDDPMMGLEESVSGTYIPPGLVTDKLMVYDLNRIFDDPAKGREIPVQDGVNYKTITLHKAIVGGDPDDPADREAYPGCVLVNVPKF